jgi:hypothetical protein
MCAFVCVCVCVCVCVYICIIFLSKEKTTRSQLQATPTRAPAAAGCVRTQPAAMHCDETDFSRWRSQLVGCGAMLVAAKYEEIYAPEIRDFVYISDKVRRAPRDAALRASTRREYSSTPASARHEYSSTPASARRDYSSTPASARREYSRTPASTRRHRARLRSPTRDRSGRIRVSVGAGVHPRGHRRDGGKDPQRVGLELRRSHRVLCPTDPRQAPPRWRRRH